MKKLLYVFSALALLFVSCSSEDTPEDTSSTASVLLKRIVETDPDGIVSTATITYSGNKIVKMSFDDGTYENYTYTGDLITKSESFDENDDLYESFIYVYDSNGKLTESRWLDYVSPSGSSKQVYVYNADGTISFQEFLGDVDSQTNFYREGKIYANKYEEYVPEEVGSYPAHTITHTFTFDDKNQPMKNVTGFDKTWFAFSGYGINSANNITSDLHTNTLGVYQPITSTVYTYNSQNYPITEAETNHTNSDEVTNIQYFYE